MFSWKFFRIFQKNYFVEHCWFLMTVTYFFFRHLFVFWVSFTSVRVTLELVAINVEKLCGEDSRRIYFFASTEKIFLSFVGSYYWDSFRFNQSIIFSKIVIKTELKQDLSLQYFTKYLSLTIVLITIKLELQIKAT